MSPSKRDVKKQAKARQRHRLQAYERLERDRRQAQRAAEALGLPENLVVVGEIEGRLRSQQKLLGKIIGGMLPAPGVVAESWFRDSKRMQHVGDTHQGTLLVEGKQSYIFTLADGHEVKGHDLIQGGSPPAEPGVYIN